MVTRLFTLASIASLLLCAGVGLLWVTRPDARSLNVHSVMEFEWEGRRWAIDSVPRGLTLSDRPERLEEEARLDREMRKVAMAVRAAEAEYDATDRAAVAASNSPSAAQEAIRVAALRQESADRFEDRRVLAVTLTRLRTVRAAALSSRVAAATTPSVTYARAAGYAALLPLLWLVRAGWHLNRSRLRRERNLCPGCGYDLRGTPGRCPECGWGRSESSREGAAPTEPRSTSIDSVLSR